MGIGEAIAKGLAPEGVFVPIRGRDEHRAERVSRGNRPVVQVFWDDATANSKWAGKRLSTEAESLQPG